MIICIKNKNSVIHFINLFINWIYKISLRIEIEDIKVINKDKDNKDEIIISEIIISELILEIIDISIIDFSFLIIHSLS